MTLRQLRDTLAEHPAAALRITRADGAAVPAEFHVTEVGRTTKHFIDCGGTVRKTEACTLQLWVAQNDADHRLGAAKLLSILRLAEKVVPDPRLAVEAEYQGESVTVYGLTLRAATAAAIDFALVPKSTTCLAPDKCRVTLPGGDCGPAGCC